MISKKELKELSYAELNSLRKMVMREVEKRDTPTKSSMGFYEKLYMLFDIYDDESRKEKDPEHVAVLENFVSRCDKSVTVLCDLILGNYNIDQKTKKAKCNTSVILTDPETYKKMLDDIYRVLCKYYNDRLKGESV